MWWLLTREVLRLRGSISREVPWEIMVDLYFYRDPNEEVPWLLASLILTGHTKPYVFFLCGIAASTAVLVRQCCHHFFWLSFIFCVMDGPWLVCIKWDCFCIYKVACAPYCSCLSRGHWARRWIDHWVCDAWLVRCQTYGYLSGHKTSPPLHWYQIIVLGDRHMSLNNLP